MSPKADEERWNQLFSKLNEQSVSHSKLKTEIRATNSVLESCVKRLDDHESRKLSVQNNFSRFDNFHRNKNIILFNLEDSDQVNSMLFQSIELLFKEIGLDIPDLDIADIYRLGKIKGKRPVLISFIAARWVKSVFSKLSALKSRNLFISNDRTPEERVHRRNLLKKIQELNALGTKAKIVNNKIVLMEEDVSVARGEMVQEDNFQREAAVASNDSSSLRKKKRGRSVGSTKEKRDLRGSNLLDSFLSPRVSLDSGRLVNKKLKFDGLE